MNLVQEIAIAKVTKETAMKMLVELTAMHVNLLKEIKDLKEKLAEVPKDKEEMTSLVKSLIPKVKDGEDGKTPTDEHLIELIKPHIPKVKDGETPDEDKLKGIIEPLIPKIKSTKSQKLTLVRHGQTALNADGKLRGWRDVPLDKVGVKQAEVMGKKLEKRNIDLIFTSDLKRAEKTAKVLSEHTEAPIAEVTRDLRPWDLGIYTGKDIKESLPAMLDYVENKPDEPIPGGESFNQFKTRFLTKVKDLLCEYPDQHIAIVAHHRNDRILDAWIANGAPDDLSIDEKVFERNGINTGGFKTHNMETGRYHLTTKEIESLIESKLPKSNEKTITVKDIDGLEQTLHAFNTQLKSRGGYLHGSGVPSLSAGSGITLVKTSDGGYTVSALGGFNTETPTGTVDGSNTTFTVSNQPKMLIIDGIVKIEGFGYTYAGGTITVDPLNPPVLYIKSFY